MIAITEATTPGEMKQFVQFPFEIYKNTPQWIPPLINDEMASFNPAKNPFFENARAWFYLAKKDGRIVGRVAAIANDQEIQDQGLQKMRFGWLDFVDDPEVSRALLEQVAAKGKELNLEYMEGPMGFSNLDKVGMMTEGFETTGTMITWYNHPYYPQHMKGMGFSVEKEYIESIFPASNADPAFFMKASALIKKRYGLVARGFSRTKDLMPYADEMFDLFNKTYSRLSSFVAISEVQKDYMKKKYLNFINPEYIKFIFNKEEEMIAFAIVMPSFSEALKKARGKLFPLGWYHLMKARRESKDVIFYLIGIREDFQNKGVTAVIFEEYHKTFTEKGIQQCYRTPELSDNIAIQQIWKHFDPKICKRRCTYRKDL